MPHPVSYPAWPARDAPWERRNFHSNEAMLNKTGVCVYVSQSKRENHPVPQEGGWEIEWPYIDKDMVCVCMYGKRETILFHKGGVGR